MSALEEARIESDEDGWHLVLTFDAPLADWLEAVTGDGRLNLRMPNDVAEQLLKETGPVREYFAERDEAHREWRAMREPLEELIDPAEQYREAADLRRKADREGGIG